MDIPTNGQQAWQVVHDPTGRPYYHNIYTNETSWANPQSTAPSPSPPASIDIPSSLPPGWEEAIDPQGRVYYIDHLSKQTSWVHPYMMQKPATPVPSTTPPQKIPATSSQTSHISYASSPPFAPGSYPGLSTATGYPKLNGSSATSSASMESTTPDLNYAEYYSDFGTTYDEQQAQFEELERLKNLTKPRSQSQSSGSTSASSTSKAAVKPTPPPPTPQSTLLAADATPAAQGIFKRFNFPPIDTDLPQLSMSKPLWEIAKEKPTCTKCGMEYTFLKRRHHCRCCCREYCDTCTMKRATVEQFGFNEPVRVCEQCARHLERKEKACLPRLGPYLSPDCGNIALKAQAAEEIVDLLVREEHNGILEDLLATNVLDTITSILLIQAQNPPSGTSSESNHNRALGLAVVKILAQATEDGAICEAVAKREIVSALYTVLSWASKFEGPVLVYAAKTLCHLAQIDKHKALVAAEGIHILINSLQSTNEDLQVWTAQTLQTLCTEAVYQQRVVEQDGVYTLVPLLSSKNDSLVLCVSIILHSLASNNKTRDAIYNAGGVSFLLGQVASKQVAVQSRALDILEELSALAVCCQAIANSEGGIQAIVSLLKKSVETIQEQALKIILNLLAQRESKELAVYALLEDNMQGLVSLLLSSKKNIQGQALSLFIALLDCSAESKECFRASGGLASLLSIASSRNGHHLLALQALAKLAEHNEENCNTLFEIGGVSVLVDLLTAQDGAASDNPHENLEVQLYAVLALGCLSYSPKVIAEFPHIERGAGVQALVSLMAPGQDSSVQEAAVNALAKLAQHEECARTVYKLGGVAHAAQLIKIPRVSLQVHAMRLIEILSAHSAAVQKAIGETDVIQSMVQILGSFVKSGGAKAPNSELIPAAICALVDACRDSDANRAIAFQAGCCAPLLALIGVFANEPEAQLRVVHLLSAFASDPHCRNAIREGRGIHALTELLFLHNNTAKDSKEGDVSIPVQIQCNVVVAIAHMVNRTMPQIAQDVLESGAILALAPLLSSKNPMLLEYTTLALGNIASTHPQAMAAVISQEEIVPGALNLLRNNSSSPSIVQQALYLLSSLAPHPELCTMFEVNGGVEPILNIITKGEVQLKRMAIGFFNALVSNPRSVEQAAAIWQEYVKQGSAEGLVALLDPTNASLPVPALQWRAANVIATVLGTTTEGRNAILDASGHKALVGMLLSPIEYMVAAQLVAALSRVSSVLECAKLIVESGALVVVIKLMATSLPGSPSPAEVEAQGLISLRGTDILADVALHAEYRSAVVASGALPRIIDALFAQNPDQQGRAAQAISLLTQDATTAQMVFENGGLLALVPLLSSSQSNHARSTAALAISNLARFYPPSRAAILHSEEGTGLGLILGVAVSPLKSSDGSVSVKPAVMELLESLSVEQGFSKVIDTLGGLSNLIAQLDEKTAAERKEHIHLIRLLNIFSNIARDPKVRESLLGTDILGRLAKIITIDSQSILVPFDALSISQENDAALLEARERHKAEAKAAELLSVLAISDDVKARINSQDYLKGIIPALVQLVQRAGAGRANINPTMLPEVVRVACSATKTLALLAYNESNREVIREVGGLEALAHIIRTPTSSSNVDEVDETDLIVNSVWAVGFLALTDKNREVLLKNGGIPAIISLFGSPTEQVQLLAVRTLRSLSSYSAVSNIFATSNFGNKYLCDILSTQNSSDLLLSQTLELVQSLLSFDMTRKAFREYMTSSGSQEKVKENLQNRQSGLQQIVFSLDSLLYFS